MNNYIPGIIKGSSLIIFVLSSFIFPIEITSDLVRYRKQSILIIGRSSHEI